MNNNNLLRLLGLTLLLAALAGCSGNETFSKLARAGDTVAVAIGSNPYPNRATMSVRITDSAGGVTEYPIGDARIRAAVNLYPDPLSRLMAGWFTNQELEGGEPAFATELAAVSQPRHDWRQALVFVDLPTTMALGPATVQVTTGGGRIKSSTVEIVAGVGSPHSFSFSESGGAEFEERFQSLERMAYTRVYIRPVGNQAAQAVQFELSHAPDLDHGGSGRVYVTQPRADLMSLNWHDDGTTLKVIMSRAGPLPAAGGQKPMFAFYVAGGVRELQPVSVVAVDVNGTPLPTPAVYMSPLIDAVEPAGPLSVGNLATVRGSGLCITCNGDYEVWVLGGTDWIRATASSATPTAISFTVPSGVLPGPGVVWVGNSEVETDYAVQFQ